MKILRINSDNAASPNTLEQIMNALSPRALAAEWFIASVDGEPDWLDITGPGRVKLEELAHAGKPVSGHVLKQITGKVQQVIWGMFTARLLGLAEQPWVTIRAIDSTFYEIITDDPMALKAIYSSFKDVREAGDIWRDGYRTEA